MKSKTDLKTNARNELERFVTKAAVRTLLDLVPIEQSYQPISDEGEKKQKQKKQLERECAESRVCKIMLV